MEVSMLCTKCFLSWLAPQQAQFLPPLKLLPAKWDNSVSKNRKKDSKVWISFTNEKTINGFRVRQRGNGFKFYSEHIKAENPRGNCHPNSAKRISMQNQNYFLE